MVFLLSFLKILPLLAIGLSPVFLLSGNASEMIQNLFKQCPHAAPHIPRLGIEGLDTVICAGVVGFKISVLDVEGFWVVGYLLSTFMSCYVFIAIEASRFRASWILSLTPFYALLFVAIGVSIVFPVLWLPLYFLLGCDDRSPENVWKKKISLWRVGAIAVCFLPLQFVSVGALFPFQEKEKDLFLYALQFAPMIAPFFWLPFRTTGTTPQHAGHKGVVVLHLLQAGSGIIWHLLALLFVLRDPNLVTRVLQLLWHHPVGGAWIQYFLLIDVLFFFASLVYFVLIEDGFIIASVTIMGTVLLGPATALSLYMAIRELYIAKASKSIAERKTE